MDLCRSASSRRAIWSGLGCRPGPATPAKLAAYWTDPMSVQAVRPPHLVLKDARSGKLVLVHQDEARRSSLTEWETPVLGQEVSRSTQDLPFTEPSAGSDGMERAPRS